MHSQLSLALSSLIWVALGTLVQAPEPAATVIRGSFAFPDGQAAPDVSLELHGWPTNAERLVQHGTPQTWSDVQATTRADGTFELACTPPGAYQFVLTAQLSGFAREEWHWSELHGVTDIGRMTLRPSGSVAGRVLAENGTPLSWASLVVVDVHPAGGISRSPVRESSGATSRGNEKFRIDGLPAGRHQLTLEVLGGPSVDGPVVDVIAGETRVVDVVYRGPDLTSCLAVSLNTYPVFWAHPQLESIVLLDTSGQRLAAAAAADHNGVMFRGLGAGPFTLRIDDPAFEPLEVRELQPGPIAVRARLIGRGALALHVRDAEQANAEVERFDAALRLEPGTYPKERNPWHSQGGTGGHVVLFSLLRANEAPPSDGVLRSIAPGSYTLILKVADRAPEFIALPNLGAGETRRIEVTVRRGGTIVGEVTAGNAPLAADLALFSEGEQELPPLDRYFAGEPTAFERASAAGSGYERAKLETGGDGRFRLQNVAPGRYVVRARAKGKLLAGVSSFIEVVDGTESKTSVALSDMPDPFAEMRAKR